MVYIKSVTTLLNNSCVTGEWFTNEYDSSVNARQQQYKKQPSSRNTVIIVCPGLREDSYSRLLSQALLDDEGNNHELDQLQLFMVHYRCAMTSSPQHIVFTQMIDDIMSAVSYVKDNWHPHHSFPNLILLGCGLGAGLALAAARRCSPGCISGVGALNGMYSGKRFLWSHLGKEGLLEYIHRITENKSDNGENKTFNYDELYPAIPNNCNNNNNINNNNSIISSSSSDEKVGINDEFEEEKTQTDNNNNNIKFNDEEDEEDPFSITPIEHSAVTSCSLASISDDISTSTCEIGNPIKCKVSTSFAHSLLKWSIQQYCVEDLQVPLLIMHGKHNRVHKPEEAHLLFEAYEGKFKELYWISDPIVGSMGLDCSDVEELNHLVTKILCWTKQCTFNNPPKLNMIDKTEPSINSTSCARSTWRRHQAQGKRRRRQFTSVFART